MATHALLQLLLVGCGGFVGAAARHAVGLWLLAPLAHRFPGPTLAANVSGCLLVGVLTALVDRQSLGGDARLLLIVGVLGGYTTFSAFGLETLLMVRRGDTSLAAAYVVGSVLLGLFAVWLGFRAVGLLPPRG